MNPELERLLLGCLSIRQPTSLNDAVTRLCAQRPDLREQLTAGAQPPCLAGPEAQRIWASILKEGWGRLYRTRGLLLTDAGEQRLDYLWSAKNEG